MPFFDPSLGLKEGDPSSPIFGALTPFRIFSHNLITETGRYENVLREQRICQFGNMGKVEDEYHFLLVCLNYLFFLFSFFLVWGGGGFYFFFFVLFLFFDFGFFKPYVFDVVVFFKPYFCHLPTLINIDKI